MEPIYFEDIEVPSQIEGPSQTLDREEMVAFAREWDQLPIHLDDEAAGPKGVSACGAYLVAFRIRLIHRIERLPSVIASFGYDEVRFKARAHAGDRLTLFLDYVSKRPSASRPDRGVVVHWHRLVNQDGVEVMTLKDTVLVRMRPRP